MVFAAPGNPLGRAADDGTFAHLPAVNERMYARHEAANGFAPLVIGGEDVGRWNAPLRKGEVETWPNLIKQLRRRCFKPAEEASTQESAKAWEDAANANGVTDKVKAKNAKVIKDVKAAVEAADAKAAEDRASFEAAVANSAENDAQLTKGIADEAAKTNGAKTNGAAQEQAGAEAAAADGWCATCGPRPARSKSAGGESAAEQADHAAEQAGRDAAQAAAAQQRAAEAKVRAEADAATDANAAAEAKAKTTAGAEAGAKAGVWKPGVEPWDPSAPAECRSWCATNKANSPTGKEKTCTLPGCSECSFCPH